MSTERVFVVVVEDDDVSTIVCASLSEAVAKEVAERCGGHVDAVILISSEGA